MPIKAEMRWFYPIDWPQLSQHVRFERAGGVCQLWQTPPWRIRSLFTGWTVVRRGIVGPGAIIAAARPASPTEKKRLAYARPASFWLLPTSIIIQAIIG